jgi:hypothetical protein
MGEKKSMLLLVVVIVVVAIAGFLVFKMPVANTNTASMSPSGVGYQAVFLVNNQVYFGKLAGQNSQFPVLKDIYYLQVNQPIQPLAKGQAAANPEINLVKLGGELHGPTDEMRINRDQILLIEDLRADSNLVKAIDNYKTRNAAPAK